MSDATQNPATKLTYIDGRATEIVLKRIKLDVISGGTANGVTFEKDVVTVGSAPDNDLPIQDDTVSRYHCKIYLEGDQYVIEDLGSTNGTFVNRVQVKEAYLKPECIVNLGKSEMRFMPVDETVRVVPSKRSEFGELKGSDAKMREIYAILEKIAPTDASIIVEGETGTGKEVVARSIHQESNRKDGPFVVFDCGAVPENLIESELFGHEKGAFTGAIGTRQGVFENAHGGTVFLDELGELALELQPKLLRVLEQREIKRVGSNKPIKVDVRVVAATNRDLAEEVQEQRFRQDLYYRLSVVRVHLPSLRTRRGDIPLLIEHFLRRSRFNRGEGGEPKITQISSAAMDHLMAYTWPGNVRELANVIERAVSFAESDEITVGDLPPYVVKMADAPPTWNDATSVDGGFLPPSAVQARFKDAKEQWLSVFEKGYIEQLLKDNGFNISHAAREAEIDRKYFRKLMKKHDITANPDDDDE